MFALSLIAGRQKNARASANPWSQDDREMFGATAPYECSRSVWSPSAKKSSHASSRELEMNFPCLSQTGGKFCLTPYEENSENIYPIAQQLLVLS